MSADELANVDIELPQFPAPRRTSSLAIFLNSTRAFTLREFRNRFGGSRLGLMWTILDPAFSCAVFVLMHALIRGNKATIYGQAALIFFVYGVVPVQMFTEVKNAQVGTILASRGLFNYRQVRPIDLLLAKSMIDFCILGFVMLAFFVGCWFFGVNAPIQSISSMLGAFLLLFALSFSAGLAIEVYGTVFPELKKIFNLLMRPLFLLSGPFYTIGMIPQTYRPYLLWNPLLHLTDMIRDAAYQSYESKAEPLYVIECTMVLLFLGLAGYRRHLHRIV